MPPLFMGAPYPDQPPPAHTGGIGEPTCQRCHFGAPLNAPTGALTLSGPGGYVPGRRYRLRAELERAGMRRAGFQLAARFAEGSRAGSQAGALCAPDERIEVLVDSNSVQYAQHTYAGTALQEPNRALWAVEWTAPEEHATVVFHLVANAANDDASEFGDFVYATSVAVRAK